MVAKGLMMCVASADGGSHTMEELLLMLSIKGQGIYTLVDIS